jgi:non-heme chloroperoxidase
MMKAGADTMKENSMNRRTIVQSAAVTGAGAVLAAAGNLAAGAQSSRAAPISAPTPRLPFIETADGASLFYNDWGSGKPIVFSHAWGLNADIWEYQLTALADQGFRCVAYDRRGHGRSPDPGRGYDYDTLSNDLAVLLEELDLHDVTLVGFSMGSGEVARYLSRHGAGRIARILLVSPVSPRIDPAAGGGLFDGFVAALKKDRPAFFAAGVPLFVGSDGAVSPAMTQWVLEQFMRASPRAVLGCMHAVATSDFRADFAAIKLPTLVIHGSDDQVNPLENTGRLTAAAIPGSELRIYDGAPHGLVITHRERFTKDLMAFGRG